MNVHTLCKNSVQLGRCSCLCMICCITLNIILAYLRLSQTSKKKGLAYLPCQNLEEIFLHQLMNPAITSPDTSTGMRLSHLSLVAWLRRVRPNDYDTQPAVSHFGGWWGKTPQVLTGFPLVSNLLASADRIFSPSSCRLPHEDVGVSPTDEYSPIRRGKY